MVYYPMILPHCPFDPTPDSEEWDPNRLGSTTYAGDMNMHPEHFSDMVSYMDKLVGQILQQLEKSGVRDNTLIIFTGDNGSDQKVMNRWNGKNIHGGKNTMRDEGVRVPLIVSWPGKIAPASLKTELVDFSDFFPTLLEVAGIGLPTEYPGDGVSLVPSFLGEGTRDKPWVYVWNQGKEVFARTLEYVYLCNADLSDPKFYRSSGPYDLILLTEESLDEGQCAIREMLREVVVDLAKTRQEGAAELQAGMLLDEDATRE